MVRAGIHSVSAATLLERALAAPDARPLGALRVLSAGKAANAMAIAAGRILGGAIRGGLVVSHVEGQVPPTFQVIRVRAPSPGLKALSE